MASKKIEYPAAVTPATWDLADLGAVQAIVRGDANKEQQQRAINWILYQVCGIHDLEYRPDPRDHAFVSGKRAAGLEIIKAIKLNLGAFRKDKKNSEQG